MAKFKVGQTVRITEGKYKGLVGEWRGRGDVWVKHVGNTAGVPERILEDATGSPHREKGNTDPGQSSPSYEEWERAAKGSDRDREAYSKKYFQNRNAAGELFPANKGISRLVFGKYGQRSRNGI